MMEDKVGVAPLLAPGVPMIEQVEIANYRSFKEARLRDCRRLNLIVGDNGSGKTALLEAIFLVAGVSPDLINKTRAWRGFATGEYTGYTEDLYKALWGDLFHKMDLRLKPKITLKGSARDENRNVTISYTQPGSIRVKPPTRDNRQSRVVAEPILERIRFDYHVGIHGNFTVRPIFSDGKIEFDAPPTDSVVRGAFLAANRLPTPAELAGRFSKLSIAFEEKAFVSSFVSHFKQVEDISLEVYGGQPMLYAQVAGIPSKIPLANVSGGMMKLAGILLAIADHPDGIVIIDEIENGFYYEKMPDIWRTVLDYAEKYNTQLFVSTHSAECAHALVKISTDSDIENLRLMRTVLREDESIVRNIDGQDFRLSIESGIEFR